MVLHVMILQELQNSNGPSTDPCGTPQVCFSSSNLTLSMITA